MITNNHQLQLDLNRTPNSRMVWSPVWWPSSRNSEIKWASHYLEEGLCPDPGFQILVRFQWSPDNWWLPIWIQILEKAILKWFLRFLLPRFLTLSIRFSLWLYWVHVLSVLGSPGSRNCIPFQCVYCSWQNNPKTYIIHWKFSNHWLLVSPLNIWNQILVPCCIV